MRKGGTILVLEGTFPRLKILPSKYFGLGTASRLRVIAQYRCGVQVPPCKPSSWLASVPLLSLVPEEGLEPSTLAGHDFESCAYAIPPLRLVCHSSLPICYNEIRGGRRDAKRRRLHQLCGIYTQMWADSWGCSTRRTYTLRGTYWHMRGVQVYR